MTEIRPILSPAWDRASRRRWTGDRHPEMKPHVRVPDDDSPFTFQTKKALVVGVVNRLPTYIEGIMRTEVEVDGEDANDAILEMLDRSRYREQLKLIMFDGIAVGGFNVIDIDRLYSSLNIPCATVTRGLPDLERMEKACGPTSRTGKTGIINGTPFRSVPAGDAVRGGQGHGGGHIGGGTGRVHGAGPPA